MVSGCTSAFHSAIGFWVYQLKTLNAKCSVCLEGTRAVTFNIKASTVLEAHTMHTHTNTTTAAVMNEGHD